MRKIEKFENKKWIIVNMKELKIDDIFKMTDVDDDGITILENAKEQGNYNYIALEEAKKCNDNKYGIKCSVVFALKDAA